MTAPSFQKVAIVGVGAIGGLGTTVVIVEHHLELVASLCRSVTVLEGGKVLAEGTPQEIVENAEVRKVYLGENFRM